MSNEREQFEAWLYVHRNERWSAAVLAFEAFKAGAALSAPPAGYVLVPVTPTEAMIRAGGHANSEWLNDNAPIGESRYGGPVITSIWIDMLAAAPQPAEPWSGDPSTQDYASTVAQPAEPQEGA